MDNGYSIDDVFDRLSPYYHGGVDMSAPPGAVNAFTDSISPVQLDSGELQGNTTVVDGYLKSQNYVAGVSGWYLDPTTGEFNFAVSVDTLDIPDTVTANSFHVDIDGDTWWGATTLGASVASVSKAGVGTFSNIIITGGSVTGVPISGIPNSTVTDLSLMEVSHDLVFSVTDADTIAWGAGTIVMSNGRTFSISAGNTGNMAALTYIYLDPAVSSTVLQTTTTYSTAMGNNKRLIGTAQNHTVTASFIPYGPGVPLIDGANIGALSIVAGNIAASTITAAKMSVSQLSAITADLGAITAGTITVDTAGYMRGGQTAYNTGTGFFLGYSGAAYKFSVGDPTGSYITWDGAALTISGVQKVLINLTAGENVTAGQMVGADNLTGGRVARSGRTGTSAAHSITTPLATGGNQAIQKAIGGNKFVRLDYTAAGSDTLFAQVIQVNPTTLDMTVGTALTVATAFTPAAQLINAAVCKLDTDKFIVFYLLDASATIIKYRVGTVAGTTITFGTEATFFTAASTLAGTAGLGADFISTDKGIMFFKAATTANSKMVAFTVATTTATAGAGVSPGANSQLNGESFIKTIATDKYVLVTLSDGSDNCYGQACTLSGTTITAGTEVAMYSGVTTSASDETHFDVISPATDVFIVKAPNAGNTVNFVAGTVATRTITAGAVVTNTAIGSGGMWAQSATSILAFAGSDNTIYKMTLSGATLTNVGTIVSTINSGAGVAMHGTVVMDGGYPITFTSSDGTNIFMWISGMANGFIGVAQSTISSGATVPVLVGGVDSNQTGLYPGAYYQIVSGALVFVGSTATVNSVDDEYVKAISTTQIII